MGDRRGLRARADVELGEDARDVHARGLLGHEQLGADLAVGRPAGDEVEDLAFARRQPERVAAAEDDGNGADPFGLTPRERQVLDLVAAGATNREIGAQLYMAEKTASVHVSRILAKLDVRTRTEAAAVAHRFGLGGGAGRDG